MNWLARAISKSRAAANVRSILHVMGPWPFVLLGASVAIPLLMMLFGLSSGRAATLGRAGALAVVAWIGFKMRSPRGAASGYRAARPIPAWSWAIAGVVLIAGLARVFGVF